MKNRDYFISTCLLAAVLVGCSAGPGADEQGEGAVAATDGPPNILLIVGDDMGFSDVGVFGSEVATPSIDALANQGVMFTNFHVGATCSPTRSLLMSGVDNHLNGMGNMHEFLQPDQIGQPGYEGYLNDKVVTIPAILRANGYYTAMAGKWHLGSEEGSRPFDRGFTNAFALLEGAGDNYSDTSPAIKYGDSITFTLNGEITERPEGIHSNTLYTDKLIEFLDSDAAQGKPFFAYLSFQTAHWPHQAPQEYRDKYTETYKAGWDEIRAGRIERMQEFGVVPADAPTQPRFPLTPAWDSLSADQQESEAAHMAVYAGMIEHMDSEIGRIVSHLEETGRLENTIVIYTTDNGPDMSQPNLDASALEWFASHYPNQDLADIGLPGSYSSYGPQWAQVATGSLFGFKVWGSEGGLRVPLVVSNPARFSQHKLDEFSHVTDLAATILDVTGATHPGTEFEGRQIFPMSDKARSLVPLLEGSADQVRSPDDWLAYELLGSAVIFQGDYAAVRLAGMWGNTVGNWALYDLRRDPSQMNDLAEENSELLETMIGHYVEYSEANGLIEMPADYTAEDLMAQLAEH